MKKKCILTSVSILLVLFFAQGVYPQARDAGHDSERAAYERILEKYRNAASGTERLEAIAAYIKVSSDQRSAESALKMALMTFLTKGKTDLTKALSYFSQLETNTSDTGVRVLIQRQLIDLHGKAGNSSEVQNISAKLSDGRNLTYDDHISIAQAANNSSLWELALRHANGAIAAAQADMIPDGTPTFIRKLERLRRTGKAFAAKGWALVNLGRVGDGLAVFEEAVEHTMFSYVGMPYESEIHMYWGRTLLGQKRYDAAMEKFAPNAVFGNKKEYIEALREAYRLKHGNVDEPEFKQFLWLMREKLSPSAQDFALNDYAGNTVKLSSLRGKVVLLNFWFPT